MHIRLSRSLGVVGKIYMLISLFTDVKQLRLQIQKSCASHFLCYSILAIACSEGVGRKVQGAASCEMQEVLYASSSLASGSMRAFQQNSCKSRNRLEAKCGTF